MRELAAGADAVFLDFSGTSAAAAQVLVAERALRAACDEGRLVGVDLIPSAATLLVQSPPGAGVDRLGVYRILRGVRDAIESATTATTSADPRSDLDDGSTQVRIPVRYNGADLDEVASILGTSRDRVIELHRDTLWRVQFMGFAPGFGYLVPTDADNPLTTVGRRAQPRTRVPAGSVAIAAGYSAIYPGASPGGWQLLGSTDIRLWDESTDPPSLLTAGAVVRFVDAAREQP